MPVCLKPVGRNKRSKRNGKPVPHSQGVAPTHHNQRKLEHSYEDTAQPKINELIKNSVPQSHPPPFKLSIAPCGMCPVAMVLDRADTEKFHHHKVLLDKCCSGSLNGCREDTCPEEGFAHARFNPLRFAFVFVCFHGSRTQPSLTHQISCLNKGLESLISITNWQHDVTWLNQRES